MKKLKKKSLKQCSQYMITISKNKQFKINMGSNNDRITLTKKYKN